MMVVEGGEMSNAEIDLIKLSQVALSNPWSQPQIANPVQIAKDWAVAVSVNR